MWYNKRGLQNKRFRNSLTKQVQARMDAVMDVHRDKIDNSLAVESVDCVVYKRARIGLPCSCSITDESDAVEVIAQQDRTETTVQASHGGMFGFGEVTQPVSTSKEIELNSMPNIHPVAAMDDYEQLAFGGDVINCPVCFREGYVPAYQPVGFSLLVLTEKLICNSVGYTVQQDQPARMIKIDDDGFVEYDISVPRYFNTAIVGVWNAEELLSRAQLPVINGRTMSKSVLEQYRGRHCTIRISAEQFTHCTILFDQGARMLRCNISEESQTLDYEKELTISNLSVVISNSVGDISPQDIIVLPDRKYVLLVTEAPLKRNARNQVWEWVVQTRTVQRKEMFYNIHKGHRLL